jgi:hypothetical protein
MTPSEMMTVALAPRIEITVFESLHQVRVEKGKECIFQWFDY